MAGQDNASSGVPISNEPIQRTGFGAQAAADNEVVAAPGAGRAIRIISIFVFAAGTTTCRFNDDTTGTLIIGTAADPIPLVSNGFVLPHNPGGWGQCVEDEALDMVLGSAISVGGVITYQLVHV